MKKILSAFLAMVMIFAIVPISVSADTYGYFTYTEIYGGAIITGFDSSYEGEVIIPDTLGGYPVTSIGDSAFAYCNGITSVTIPAGVQGIGTHAFSGCKSLTSITVSEDNTVYKSVDGVLFTKRDNRLVQYPTGKTDTAYTVPDGVTYIDSYSFAHCTGLTSLTIPGSVATIGMQAFRDCTGLTSVVIENGVKKIDGYAFEYCSSLTSVIIPASVTSIGSFALPTAVLTIMCYEDSYAHTYAKDSGISYKFICENASPVAGHDLVHHDGKAPTCTEPGYAAYETCLNCDYTTYTELSATGHSPVQHDAKSATCTEHGWFAYETCENCDYSTYTEIRPHGHYFEGSACTYCGEPKPVLPGDVNGNGAVDTTDLAVFRRYIGGATISGFNETAADVNGDSSAQIADVSTLARIIAGAVIQ